METSPNKPAAQAPSLDPIVLAVQVANTVAMAQLSELEAQSIRLASLVDQGALPKHRAVDILRGAALASNLERVHGVEFIQEVISSAFMQMEVA